MLFILKLKSQTKPSTLSVKFSEEGERNSKYQWICFMNFFKIMQYFLLFYFIANKKAKLLNGSATVQTSTSLCEDHHTYIQHHFQQQHQQYHQYHQINGSINSDDYAVANYSQICGGYDRPPSRPGGPNLVNKQLVLPFIPPSFPNKNKDGVVHLIKPSEYLRSISDKRSCSSTR